MDSHGSHTHVATPPCRPLALHPILLQALRSSPSTSRLRESTSTAPPLPPSLLRPASWACAQVRSAAAAAAGLASAPAAAPAAAAACTLCRIPLARFKLPAPAALQPACPPLVTCAAPPRTPLAHFVQALRCKKTPPLRRCCRWWRRARWTPCCCCRCGRALEGKSSTLPSCPSCGRCVSALRVSAGNAWPSLPHPGGIIADMAQHSCQCLLLPLPTSILDTTSRLVSSHAAPPRFPFATTAATATRGHHRRRRHHAGQRPRGGRGGSKRACGRWAHVRQGTHPSHPSTADA